MKTEPLYEGENSKGVLSHFVCPLCYLHFPSEEMASQHYHNELNQLKANERKRSMLCDAVQKINERRHTPFSLSEFPTSDGMINIAPFSTLYKIVPMGMGTSDDGVVDYVRFDHEIVEAAPITSPPPPPPPSLEPALYVPENSGTMDLLSIMDPSIAASPPVPPTSARAAVAAMEVSLELALALPVKAKPLEVDLDLKL